MTGDWLLALMPPEIASEIRLAERPHDVVAGGLRLHVEGSRSGRFRLTLYRRDVRLAELPRNFVRVPYEIAAGVGIPLTRSFLGRTWLTPCASHWVMLTSESGRRLDGESVALLGPRRDEQ